MEVRPYIREHGKTLAAAAAACGVTTQAFYKYDREGVRPSITVCAKLAAFLDISIDQLVDDLNLR